MRDAESELKALKTHWPDAELLEEGGRKFALLPTLTVSADEKAKPVMALLQPWANGDGYTTRLYFSEHFTTKGSNWNVFNILGRSWHACSWNNVPEDLPWIEILASHLRPLQ
jgi:hypothetical protein